jgi:tRNA uridine 5-carbamoylmethylation protein Kti12
MATLIAMHGLPRSGKSTISRNLSQQLSAPVVNADSIRLALHGQVYERHAEPMVRAIKKIMIEALFGAGHEYVICDETHYSRAARDFVRDGDWDTYFYPVMTPANECLYRAERTQQPWLLSVIPEMVARYEPLGPDEPIWDDACECGNATAGWGVCEECGANQV